MCWGVYMLDAVQRRAAMIRHLEEALAVADELNEAATGYLIERALDEARSNQIGWTEMPPAPRG
jgi:hypothetical protein